MTTVSMNTVVEEIIDCFFISFSFTVTSKRGDVPIPASFVKSPFDKPEEIAAIATDEKTPPDIALKLNVMNNKN